LSVLRGISRLDLPESTSWAAGSGRRRRGRRRGALQLGRRRCRFLRRARQVLGLAGQHVDLGAAAQLFQQVADLIIGQEADDLRPGGLQRDRLFHALVLDTQDGPAALGRERTDQRALLGVLEGAGIGLGHHINGEIAQVAAVEARGLVGGALHGQGVERRAAGQQLLDALALGLGGDQDLAGADLFRPLGQLLLLGVEAADGVLVDGLFHHALDQHVAQDALASGGQAALSHGILVQLALQGLGGQQLLVDHLVEALAEQLAGDVQRLALADQALGHGLALDVGRPDIVAVDARHGGVARLGRLLGALVLTASGQEQRGGQGDPNAGMGWFRQDGSPHGLRIGSSVVFTRGECNSAASIRRLSAKLGRRGHRTKRSSATLAFATLYSGRSR
jgi:hypothetical protein